jgi:hypothetical protein
MDMKATLRVGVVASDIPGDGGRLRLRGLLKGNGAGDLGVTTEDSDYIAIASLAMTRFPSQDMEER